MEVDTTYLLISLRVVPFFFSLVVFVIYPAFCESALYMDTVEDSWRPFTLGGLHREKVFGGQLTLTSGAISCLEPFAPWTMYAVLC